MEADGALADESARLIAKVLRRTALAVAGCLLAAILAASTLFRPSHDFGPVEKDGVVAATFEIAGGGVRAPGKVSCDGLGGGRWSCFYEGRGMRCRVLHGDVKHSMRCRNV